MIDGFSGVCLLWLYMQDMLGLSGYGVEIKDV